jgi:twitching motility protein PilT
MEDTINSENNTNMEIKQTQQIRAKIKLSFRKIDDDSRHLYSVITRDISLDAVSFFCDELIAVQTKIEIIITIPHADKSIICIGLIVNAVDLGLKGYLYNVNFLNLDKEKQAALKDRIGMLNIDMLFDAAVKAGASDIHLCKDYPPLFRIGGKLVKTKMPELTRASIEDILNNALSQKQLDELITNLELNSSCDFTPTDRFRFNIHFQRGDIEATFRRISTGHNTISTLGLPAAVRGLTLSRSGLIIITGKTNNGKSTTAAAMIELINEEKNSIIMTIEDPIEFVHVNKKSVIKQREVGIDTKSFSMAAKQVLRQDCDVIFIGEILDPDTLLVALRAAEVGHLVITTFPARDTVQAIERMVYSVEPFLQEQVKMQLSSTLLCILAQRLYPGKNDPEKQVLATELLINSPAVKSSIRTCNLTALRDRLQTGSAIGMHTMQQDVADLVKKKLIDEYCILEIDKEEIT